MGILHRIARKVRNRLPVPLTARLIPARSPLATLDAAPLDPASLGRVLLLAPHPDDESLGCGGLLAALARRGAGVRVVFASDGEASHRRSRSHPPDRLGALRRTEALAALAILGVPGDAARFLGLPDRAIPGPGTAGFAPAVAAFATAADGFAADTVVLPWRRDPSADHRAAWAVADAGARAAGLAAARRLEYPVWLWHDPADRPAAGEVRVHRVDVGRDLARKRRAILAHRSQTTALIADDPTAFRLSNAMQANFHRASELYFEPIADRGAPKERGPG
jgi:LmbE family N-acetylglucosaminyl deacetylase